MYCTGQDIRQTVLCLVPHCSACIAMLVLGKLLKLHVTQFQGSFRASSSTLTLELGQDGNCLNLDLHSTSSGSQTDPCTGCQPWLSPHLCLQRQLLDGVAHPGWWLVSKVLACTPEAQGAVG